MRIAYQCNGFLLSTVGGAEVWLYHLTKELARRGHELLIFVRRELGEPVGAQQFDGLDLVRMDFGPAMASRNLKRLREVDDEIRRRLDAFRPDVLHLNDTWLSSFFFRRGAATGHLPRLLTIHSTIAAAGDDSLLGRLVNDADGVTAVSEAQGQSIRSVFSRSGAKLTVIPNALPLPAVQPSPLPQQWPGLFCGSRLIADKGIDIVIRAVALLHASGLRPRLTVAGTGDQETALAGLARDLGIADTVGFLGKVQPDQMPGWIDDSTLVLVPSRWAEPFGLIALQAAQMGRPAIVSDRGGLPEVVEHQQTGLVMSSERPEDWAAAIRSLLEDPVELQNMGRRARDRAVSVFGFPAMVDRYEQLLQQIAGSGGRHLGDP